ncbi:histidine kinase N-terminal 7TM domain-containing diguanylate cyclase [Litchfieldia alkalitelluris]|uniref:histidine kinase N-terminal 7TM domain-containing diguanylate cyclase n=1 Tax=Litchfieldia alkalitelluris TaxID=304268 RepID=UPI001F3B4F2A|nr:histidine kinase N-terminal 7TM domain-containing protein [Litchfieldia alkalitelluris]
MQELLMYILIMVMGGLLSLFLSLYTLIKIKNAPGANYFIISTLLVGLFTFAYAFELASPTIEQIKFWLKVEYIALPFIPVFILLMCFQYAGQKIPRWLYYFLFGIPISTVFMNHTNEFHQLYYTSMELQVTEPFLIIDLEGGPWFYVHSFFLYLCITASVVVLLRQLKKRSYRFKMQILLMVAGLLVPIVASVFYLVGLSPRGIDLGPVSTCISFIFHGIALLSFQMFNLAPIARETVFENMGEGVIVLNPNDVIVDYNQALLKVIPNLDHHCIGKSISAILKDNMKLANIILMKEECDFEWHDNGEFTHYHIRFSSVKNKKSLELGCIVSFVNITERVNMQKRLQLLASMDGLTQVYNRAFLEKKAEELLKTLVTEGGSISMLMFDIDHFKNVNDTFGHEAGDLVLTQVTKLAKDSLRSKDMIGRYGGEEFIICMINTPFEEVLELANKIRLNISDLRLNLNGKDIRVTSSFGISNKDIPYGEDTITIKALMRQADQALYTAKNNGRNCVKLFNEIYEYTG